MRLGFLLGALAAVGSLSLASDARACGGCFHPPTTQTATVVTDHRMIFAVSPSQTTLYDQIKYSGAPSSFAWVLPIHGTVSVALSADIVFSALDQVTQTTIVAPPVPSCPQYCGFSSGSGGGSNGGSGGGSSSGGVTVLTQQVVGPYDTVQLSSTSATALGTWLAMNGYAIPSSVQPIIAAYVTEGFDFLAMRLSPGQSVQSMRPVSVTSPGAGLTLPLRMVAAGTGATVGITLWVVATGRYEPKNFPFFTISPSNLIWDWSRSTSNFATLVAQQEAAFQNAAWQIESSIDLAPTTVEQIVLGNYYVGGAASSGFMGRAPELDYLPVLAPDGGTLEGGSPDGGGSGQTADQVRTQDLATLFAASGSTVRVTRLRGDLSQAALANDLVLQASADQSQLGHVYQVTQSVNAPVCPQCGGGTSNGSSASGSGASSGPGSSASGGGGGGSASPGHEASGCSASGPGGENFVLAIAGFVAMAFARGRPRAKR